MSSSSPSLQTDPQASARGIWQGQRANGGSLLGAFRRRAIQVFWGALLLSALGLFAWLVWLLLLAPKRTPVVVLSAAPYSWPLPPNAWAAEDFQKLGVLDGETITISGNDDPVFRKAGFLERLDKQIQRSADLNPNLPLIVWISLHGVANNSDETLYLIPPQASPTDAATWIKFDDVISKLRQVTAKRNALLILDCNRMQVNWNIGLLANRFSERVQAVYRQRVTVGKQRVQQPGSLAVLLSADAQEQSFVSRDLNGSLFGHSMQLGLAGAADQRSNSGNNDGWVDVAELHRYVETNVQWRAEHSRGQSQKPVLLTPGKGSTKKDSNFRLTRCLNRDVLHDLIVQQSKTKRIAAAIPSSQLDPLWQSLGQFRDSRLYQREPIAFRNLEHNLLWLEQLSVAGTAYRTLALRTQGNLVSTFDGIEDRLSKLPQRRTFGDVCSLISGNKPRLPRSLKVHSLPLTEYFGTQDIATNIELRDRFKGLADQPNPSSLAATLAHAEEKSKSLLASTQFLRMLDRYQIPSLWQRADLVGNLLSTQSAIQDFSVPRDPGGIPSSIRVHRWNRALLAHIDPVRRDAEDAIFLRQQNGLEDKLIETSNRYNDAVVAAKHANQTMQVCDQAMATTAYLAQWITDPRRSRDPAQTKAIVDGQVLPLIENSLELSKRLADAPKESDDLKSVINAIDLAHAFATETVTSTLAALGGDLADRQRRLVNESESNRVETIGQIEAILSVPLTDWKSRRDLRGSLERLVVRVHQSLEGQSIVGSDDDGDVAENYVDQIDSWEQHPLLAILGESKKTDKSQQNAIQRFLDSIDAELALQKGVRTVEGQRAICSNAAGRLRTAAPIWFQVRKHDPVVELRRVDIESLLVWHAERVTADFWGPAGRGFSFYELAANDYCNSVNEMDPGLDEVTELRARIEAGQKSLPTWMNIASGPTIQLDRVDNIASEFTVTSNASSGFVPPQGTATVVLRSDRGRIDVATIRPSDAVILPAVDGAYQVMLPAELGDATTSLKAETIFRGHEYGGTLDIQQLGGITIDVHPFRYRQSEVTLNSPWDKLSVAFVLDCSASMKESLDGESRIAIAKEALQEMLFNLGLRRNVRLGVRAFGHRLGWSVDEPVKSLTRPDFTGEIAEGITASQDVETLLSMGTYDLATAQWVIPKVGEVKPWGQSPLYLSVMQSINEFSSEDDDADRHVIVITDGANYQYIPSAEFNIQATTGNDVRSAWGQQQVPVHILGLGMDRDQDREAVQEFTQLCLDTGGGFQALSRSTDLSAALRQLLAPGMYHLSELDSGQPPQQSATLGTPIRVAPLPKTPQLFDVRYDGKQLIDPESAAGSIQPMAADQVLLEGGESLHLYVNKQGTEIYAYPFQDNVAGQSALASSTGVPTDYVVRVHRPDRDHQHRVTFPVSWQRRDVRDPANDQLWRATRRPSAVWIEIQPVNPDGKSVGQAYAFFDPAYEPKQPVPLVNLVAQSWPKTAWKARIRVYSQPPKQPSSFELLPPAIDSSDSAVTNGLSTTIAINDALNKPIEIADNISVRIDPTVTQDGGDIQRRRFVVEFGDDSIPVTSVKLNVSNHMKGKPVRITRQFDQLRRMSVHTFYYDASREKFPALIDISNRDYEIDGAWELESEFIEVEVPNAGGLLPVSP